MELVFSTVVLFKFLIESYTYSQVPNIDGMTFVGAENRLIISTTNDLRMYDSRSRKLMKIFSLPTDCSWPVGPKDQIFVIENKVYIFRDKPE